MVPQRRNYGLFGHMHPAQEGQAASRPVADLGLDAMQDFGECELAGPWHLIPKQHAQMLDVF